MEAIADFRKAVNLNPNNLIAMYRLAEEIERQGDPNSDAEFQALMQRIVDAQPDNLAALLELSRIAAKRGDAAALKRSVARIQLRSPRRGHRKCRSNSPLWRQQLRGPTLGRPRCAPPFCEMC